MAFHLDQPLGIDPCVDVVFLRLFGGENEALRVDFLNAVLAPDVRIRHATVVNAIQMPTFDGQAGLRLDLKVEDEQKRVYQVEMQRRRHPGLDKRMLYGWARLYADQLGTGMNYETLRPVVCIWICEQDAFPASQRAHLRFTLREAEEDLVLHPDIRVEVIQLAHVAAGGTGLPDAALGGWCRLLNEAADWNEVPAAIQTPVLEDAMTLLDEFRTDPKLNDLYRRRLDFEREQFARAKALADETAAKEAALAEAARERASKEQALAGQEAALAGQEAERAAKEAALAAQERLAARLRALGVDPDAE